MFKIAFQFISLGHQSLSNLLVFLFLLFCNTSYAFDRPYEHDVSTLFGVAGGQLTKPASSGNEENKLTIGGIALGIRENVVLTERFTYSHQFKAVIDLINSQLFSQSLGAGVSYHIFGGPRKIYNGNSKYWMIKEYNSSFSWINQLSFEKFSFSSKVSSKLNVEGSNLVYRTGFSYRANTTAFSSFGVEAVSSLLSLPASTDNLSYLGLDILMDFRKEF